MTAQAFTQGSFYGGSATLTTATTLIGNIIGIDTAPEMSRTAIETTHSTSTGGWKTFVPGDIKDGGEIAITVQYSTQLDYGTLFGTTVTACDTITVTFPKRGTTCGAALAGTAATWSAQVVITKISPKWEFENQMAVTLTFKISGAPTYVAAAV